MADIDNFDFTEVFDTGYSEQGIQNVSGIVADASNLRVGTNPAFGITDFVQMYPNFINPNQSGTFPIIGNLTTGSNQITEIENISGINLNQIISGPGIPFATYITAINSTTVTMSNTATVNSIATSILTYFPLVPLIMLQTYISLANASIQQARWRTSWSLAMALFIAHFADLYLQSSANPMGTAAQVISAGQARGLMASKGVGDVSVSYDYNSISQDLNGWAMWKATIYGQQLATMGKMFGKGNMYVW
jgi:hypothetical protein